MMAFVARPRMNLLRPGNDKFRFEVHLSFNNISVVGIIVYWRALFFLTGMWLELNVLLDVFKCYVS